MICNIGPGKAESLTLASISDTSVLFDPTTKKVIDFCIRRIENNFPAVIVIDGNLGTGKTTLAALIADYVNGVELPFGDFLGMGSRNFMEIYDKQKGKIKCVVFDEAGDFSRRGAMTKIVQDVGRIFETHRQYGILPIVSLPRFYWLDKKLFDMGVVQVVFNCWRREQNRVITKMWFLNKIGWLQTKTDEMRRKGFPTDIVYQKVSINAHGWYKDLHLERRIALAKYSLKGKDSISSDILLGQEGLLGLRDIMQRTSRSKAWVTGRMSSLKIKPVRVYKTRKYYSKEVLGLLLGEVK